MSAGLPSRTKPAGINGVQKLTILKLKAERRRLPASAFAVRGALC